MISLSKTRWLFSMAFLTLAGCVQTFETTPPKLQTQPVQCQLFLNHATITGGCWDEGAECKPPDPYVQLYIDGQPTFRTSIQSKTFNPSWNQRAPLTKDQISHARIVLYDQDGKAKQWIAEWRVRLDWILDKPDEGLMVGSQATTHAALMDLSIRCKAPNKSPPTP